MRSAPSLVLVFLVLTALPARAQDARVAFLTKQLKSAQDPRVRSQTALLLGQTGSEAAAAPLCSLLKDAEAVVRGAAVSALGDLRVAPAIECLRAAVGEAEGPVRQSMERAITAGVVTPGSLYVFVEPVADKVGDLPPPLVELAEKLLREKLASLGAALAPAEEEKKAALALIKARKLKPFQLRLQLLPGSAANGLKVEMLVMTYPEQALKGSWNVKASGGKPEALVKAMVPRVIEDAAGDLEWKN